MDVETVHAEEGTRFGRTLSVLVGVAAVVAAGLGALQMDASTRQSRAQAEGARLSVTVFEGLAAQGMVTSFQLSSLQQAIEPSIESLARRLEALEGPDIAGYEDALAAAEEAAAQRILRIAQVMSAAPGAGSDLDPHTLEVLGRIPDFSDLFEAVARGELPEESPDQIAARGREVFDRLTDEQNRQVDLAETYGGRSDRAVFALSLLALAAVLLALAGVTGEGTTGRAAMWSGAVVLVLSAAAGGSAVLIS